MRHAFCCMLLASAAFALECLPRRTCPDKDNTRFMCVGYTDAKTNDIKLLCDGVHTDASACETYYKKHGAADVKCCDTSNCLKGSKYDNSDSTQGKSHAEAR